jgi:hypothetical protein
LFENMAHCGAETSINKYNYIKYRSIVFSMIKYVHTSTKIDRNLMVMYSGNSRRNFLSTLSEYVWSTS